MAKRFIDTSIWNKQWYRKLGAAEKVAWLYLLTSCDAVGVWDADLELAEFSIGSKVDWEALRTAANGNIEVLENGKWWVVDFCKYQHGDLISHRNSGPVRSYISLLSKHGLLERVEEQFANSCQTVKGIGLGKGKGEGTGEGEGKEERAPGVLLTTSEHDKLVAKYGVDATTAAYAKLSAYKLQSGKSYKSDYGAILHWVIDEVVKKAKGEGPRKATEGWECPTCKRVNTHTGGMCVYCKGARE